MVAPCLYKDGSTHEYPCKGMGHAVRRQLESTHMPTLACHPASIDEQTDSGQGNDCWRYTEDPHLSHTPWELIAG